ncbi:hypothetical protein ACI6PS_00830 [Flavobacterium sp. PLA-1-15]|uniref:hypothetical protein n=1 Tax=Flavobacterium sp. PLA-1-15 TaxID=3380533 RepID=UPI003B817736
MKKTTLLLLLLLVAMACGVKQTQSMVASGDYDAAIAKAVEGLRNNKDKKGKQDYVYLLEEAFAKAKDRDLRSISMLVKDANPRNFEEVFNTYVQLNKRQERIRPLLPLKLLKEGRDAKFPFDDYTDQIIDSKNALSRYLYDNAKGLLGTRDKVNFRRAYDDLVYLDQLTPNYKDVRKLMDDAKFKGTDFVHVYTKNETKIIIPVDLQTALLDFSTYGLNDKWTVYHSNKQKNTTYDYAMLVNFRQINISPEQIKEREFVNEREIVDGKKKLLDARGRVVKDSLGKDVMVDNIKIVKIKINEFRQFKSAQVVAKVDYLDLKTNQLMQTFPISSEFVFENIYAKYRGDLRAIEKEYQPYFRNRPVPFPSNEQMVYDTGEDLKAKLKNIIVQNKFRK